MGYVWGLDLIRFAAALMVVFFHLSWQQQSPAIHFDAGWVGVEIFFVISGFVIMGSARKASASDFIRKRITRLYPAAMGCALMSFAVLRLFGHFALEQHLHVETSFRALADSMFLIKEPFLTSALWTLPIELVFYGLIVLLLVGGRLRYVTEIAAALIVWSGLYVMPFALSEYGLLPVHIGSLGYGLYTLSLLQHGCFFGTGMLLWSATTHAPRQGELSVLAAGICLCCVEIAARAADLHLLYTNPAHLPALVSAAGAVFLVSVFALWMFVRTNGSFTPGRMTRLCLRKMGLMTYPLYLTHEAFGGVLYGLLRAAGHGQGVALLLAVTFSLAASLLIVQAVEPLMLRALAAVLPLRVTAQGKLMAK